MKEVSRKIFEEVIVEYENREEKKLHEMEMKKEKFLVVNRDFFYPTDREVTIYTNTYRKYIKK